MKIQKLEVAYLLCLHIWEMTFCMYSEIEYLETYFKVIVQNQCLESHIKTLRPDQMNNQIHWLKFAFHLAVLNVLVFYLLKVKYSSTFTTSIRQICNSFQIIVIKDS